MLNNATANTPPRSPGEILAFMEEMSRSAARPDDIPAIANSTLDLALACTAAEKGSLLLKERDHLRIMAGRGFDPGISTTSARIGEGIAGTVARLGTPLLVEDIDQDDRFRTGKRGRYKTRSFISCPLLHGSDIFGVLNLNDKADGSSFTAPELLLTRTIANLAAIALENACLEKRLREKSEALSATGARLAEKDISRAKFLTRLSHELRTPLNAIGGAVFYLQGRDGISPSEQMEFTGIIAGETGKLSMLVENLLGFFLLEDLPRDYRREVLELSGLLGDVVAASSLMIRQDKDLCIRLEDSVVSAAVLGDRVTVMQLLINLVNGLAGYASEGDVLGIGLEEQDAVIVRTSLSRCIPEDDLYGLFSTAEDEKRLRLYLAGKAAKGQGWLVRARNTAAGSEISLIIPPVLHNAETTGTGQGLRTQPASGLSA